MFMSSTAYGGEAGDGRLNLDLLPPHRLPIRATLNDGTKVEVAPFDFDAGDVEIGMQLMNDVIEEGRAWPFEPTFPTEESYRSYYLSHAAFVVRCVVDNDASELDKSSSPTHGEVMGTFYVKPNFPGRCSHVCNGGFITDPKFRGSGVGRLMGSSFLALARDLQYKSAYFNLVFKSNPVSIQLWESLGFTRVATIPNAARLEGVDGLDDAYGYYFDLTTLPEEFDPVDYAMKTSNC
eukprot:5415441-Ditylum_brightwellii.AAC.1